MTDLIALLLGLALGSIVGLFLLVMVCLAIFYSGRS